MDPKNWNFPQELEFSYGERMKPVGERKLSMTTGQESTTQPTVVFCLNLNLSSALPTTKLVTGESQDLFVPLPKTITLNRSPFTVHYNWLIQLAYGDLVAQPGV